MKNNGDIDIITSLIGESYDSWIRKLRIIEGMQDSPLIHERGSWSFKDRIQTFQTVSSRLFDDHLDLFRTTVVSVFKTIDPQFELAPEERYAAVIYGKVLPHSRLIRKGLSEGLALVATKQELLTNCSKYKGQYCASSVVKEVFRLLAGNYGLVRKIFKLCLRKVLLTVLSMKWKMLHLTKTSHLIHFCTGRYRWNFRSELYDRTAMGY